MPGLDALPLGATKRSPGAGPEPEELDDPEELDEEELLLLLLLDDEDDELEELLEEEDDELEEDPPVDGPKAATEWTRRLPLAALQLTVVGPLALSALVEPAPPEFEFGRSKRST